MVLILMRKLSARVLHIRHICLASQNIRVPGFEADMFASTPLVVLMSGILRRRSSTLTLSSDSGPMLGSFRPIDVVPGKCGASCKNCFLGCLGDDLHRGINVIR